MTARVRLLPSFLIIGTQRAGAAPLFKVLRKHPWVGGPSGSHENVSWSRELHFFDNRFERGIDWYRSCFPLAGRRLVARLRRRAFITGEATSSYLFDSAVPARVAETLPDIRLIVLLRNPVERAYWHYESNRRKGLELLSFEEALAAEDRRAADEDGATAAVPGPVGPRSHDFAYVARGLYADQLERWFGFFAPERFLVLLAEDLAAQPLEIYAEVLSFLQLRPWQPDHFPLVNWMSTAPIDPVVRGGLEERFAGPNLRLARLLERDELWGSSVPSEAPGLGATPTRQP